MSKPPGYWQSYERKDPGKYRAQKRAAASRRRTENPGIRHGLSKEQYGDMLRRQRGRCAICGGHGALVVDHDHSCCNKTLGCPKCVRGLLCISCNRGLALVEGPLLAKALQYLNQNPHHH